jgi:Secretion system C-terminal sorting domain
MKWICLFFVSSIYLLSLNAQSTYNYRLSLGLPSPTVFASIEVTDSCFYTTGVTLDTVFPYQISSLFAKLSLEGEVLLYKILSSPVQNFETWANTLEPTNDGNFIVPGTSIDSLGYSAILIKYNPLGDTLFTKQYRNPSLVDEDFIAGIASKISSDDGIFIASNVSDPDNDHHADIYVIKTDSLGQMEWDVLYGGDQFSEVVGSIFLISDKILISGNIHNINFSSQNFVSRALLIQMNMEGEVEWVYESPEGELIKSVSDVLKTDDGGYLLASGKGIEYGQPPGTLLFWQPYVFKLDADRNFEWGVDIRDSEYESKNILNKMIEVSDGSGYVVAGRGYRPNFSENGWDYRGLIAKISKEGDSLWARSYNYVQSPADDHLFYDLEETQDGGFVMVGNATDFFQLQSEPPIQRAWVVKVDEHGCLVPGCHLVSSSTDLQTAPFQIKLFPNPVSASGSDFLNVYFYHPELKGEAVFQLIDATGKIVLEFKSSLGDVTHMVPVSNLASGMYWLTCRVGDAVLTEAVVVD